MGYGSHITCYALFRAFEQRDDCADARCLYDVRIMGAETTNEVSDTFQVDREEFGPPKKKKNEDEEDKMEATPLPSMTPEPPRETAEP